MAKTIKKETGKESKHLRLAIIDDSHEEIRSIRFHKKLTIACAIAAFIIIVGGTYLLTSRTFIKHTIPGYPSQESKQLAVENLMKIDSLEKVIDLWAFQVSNIQRVVTGRDPLEIDTSSVKSSDSEAATELSFTKEDSTLRDQVKREEQFSISSTRSVITQIEGMHFYTPVKGMITEEYNQAIGHPYIDIAAKAGTPVCAVLDGTVVSAFLSEETGYTIELQHENNIISIYKHNEKLLKKPGDKVTAGTAISLVGDTGSLSTGAHLHFELWYKGEAINPTQYITF